MQHFAVKGFSLTGTLVFLMQNFLKIRSLGCKVLILILNAFQVLRASVYLRVVYSVQSESFPNPPSPIPHTQRNG